MIGDLIIFHRDNAPKRFRKHFNDDDLDFIAVIKKSSNIDFKSLIRSNVFGCCSVKESETKLYYLYGGYHS